MFGGLGATRYAPKPSNNRIMVVGDSLASHSSEITAPHKRILSHSYPGWAAYLSRQRFHFPATSNYGIPGNNSDDVLARIDSILSTDDAGVVVLDFETNDAANGVPLSRSKTNYTTVVAKVLAAGRIAVCIVPRPRDITASGLTMTAAQANSNLNRADFIRGQHNPTAGVFVVDPTPYLADRASTNMAMLAGMAYDGVHNTQLGGYWVGYALATLFGMGRGPGLFPFVDVLATSTVDVYDATNNPRGAVNANPMMLGGTTNATSWTSNVSNGVVATLSKVVVGAATWQQIVLSGTATGTGIVFPVYQNAVTPANLTIGDVVEGFCDFEQDAGLTGLSGCGLNVTDNTTFARSMAFDSTTTINATPLPGIAHSGVMRTPTFTLTSTGIRFGIACTAINTATISSTCRVGAMALRKVLP